MMGWWNSGWHMGWMALWWIVALAFLVAVVWAILKIGRPGASEESPEAILKRRYARGDIDRDEYERRLDDLRR